MKRALIILAGLALMPALAQGPDGMAALKQNLAQNQERLKQYEWVETTVVYMKDKERSRTQKRCYYGADGVEQKVPLTAPEPEKHRRGLRGRLAEHKKEQVTDYMEKVSRLLKLYVPPDAAKLAAALDRVALTTSGVDVHDYQLKGDTLSLDVDKDTHQLRELKVATYLDAPQDKVNLDVHFGRLDDGTSYPQQTVLEASAEHMRVETTNSGYVKH